MYFVGAVLKGTHPLPPKLGLFDSSSCALPNDVGASSWPLRLGCVLIAIRVSGLCHAALAGGSGELSMIQGDGRPVPAPA
jgi:hypothetical protein